MTKTLELFPMQSLTAYLPKRNLISVRRQDVDGHGIQGFLVGLSESLVALEYVYDFEIDGLLVLRRSDITEVRRTATDEFQERLLKQEGIRPGKQLPTPLALEGWRSVIDQDSQITSLQVNSRYLRFISGTSNGRVPAFLRYQKDSCWPPCDRG